MAQLIVKGGEDYVIAHSVGSGLGFFGSGGFGYSIAVGAWNSKTYISNADGTVEGQEIDNVKYVNSSGAYCGPGEEYHILREIPNDKCTINLTFTDAAVVDVQNVELRCYDGVSVDNAPSGIYMRGFEAIHPSSTYLNNGSGDPVWTGMSGSTSYLALSNSPASGGLAAASGTEVADTQHDWYVGLSLSPSSIGSKQAKLYFNLEYL